MRKRLTLLAVVAVLAIAALPATALAATSLFKAQASLERTDAGTQTLDLSTGLLTTMGQVFEGRVDYSSVNLLKRADVTVYQNSTIGADIFDLVTNSTGQTPLAGVAWGTFEVERNRGNKMTGEYQANILGTLTIDPTCEPTDVFAAAGIPSIPVRLQVADEGLWAPIEGTTSGIFNLLDDAGGALTAIAGGCLGAKETATITLDGVLGRSGRGNGQLKERLAQIQERIAEIRDERGSWRDRVGEIQSRIEEWRSRFGGNNNDNDNRGSELRDRLSDLFDRIRSRR